MTSMQGDSSINILTVSLSRYLVGHEVSEIIEKDWTKPQVSSTARAKFNNVGFNLDPNDRTSNLNELKSALGETKWDGVLIGWCIRGHVELTDFFEQIVDICAEERIRRRQMDEDMKLMFCEGPTNLVETTLRNFPLD